MTDSPVTPNPPHPTWCVCGHVGCQRENNVSDKLENWVSELRAPDATEDAAKLHRITPGVEDVLSGDDLELMMTALIKGAGYLMVHVGGIDANREATKMIQLHTRVNIMRASGKGLTVIPF